MNKIEALERQLAEATARFESVQKQLARINAMLKHAKSDQRVKADEDAQCARCGADVSTELLFSLHYVIPDYRLENVGNCPEKGKR